MKKPKLLAIACIKPTEPAVPQDKLEEIAAHYDGRVESIKPITGYMIDGSFYPDNGNKRAAFLYSRGHHSIFGVIQDPDPDEEALLLKLAAKIERSGVGSIDDLANRVFPRRQYETLMRSYEAEK